MAFILNQKKKFEIKHSEIEIGFERSFSKVLQDC